MSDKVVRRHTGAVEKLADDGTSTSACSARSSDVVKGRQKRFGSWIGYQLRHALYTEWRTATERGVTLKPAAARVAAEEQCDATKDVMQPLFEDAGPQLLAPSSAAPLEAGKNDNWLGMLRVIHLVSLAPLYLLVPLILWHMYRSLSAYLSGRWLQYIQRSIVMEGKTIFIHVAELLVICVLLQVHAYFDYVLVEAEEEVARSKAPGDATATTRSDKKTD